MNTVKTFFLIVLLSWVYPVWADEQERDSEILLNSLLHIKSEKYLKLSEDGEPFYNSLLEYKNWENLYVKYSNANNDNKNLSTNQIKKLLFMGFVAREKRDAAISQAFSSDFVGIYNANKSDVLDVLAKLNFLIPSSCYYLNNHFGFEDKNSDKEQPFLKENKSLIIKKLGDEGSKTCLAFFE